MIFQYYIQITGIKNLKGKDIIKSFQNITN